MFNELVVDYFKQNKVLMISFILLTILTFPLETIVIPELYSKLFIVSNNKFKGLYKIILIIVAAWIGIQIFYYIKNVLLKKLVPSYLEFIRIKLFTKIIEKYETDYKDINSSPLVQLVLTSSINLKDFFLFCCVYLLPLFFSLLIILIYFFFFDWKIGLVTLSLLAIYFFFIFKFGKEIVVTAIEREGYFYKMNESMNNSFENLMNIYLNNEKKKELKNIVSVQNKYSNELKKEYDNYSKFTLSSSIISVIIFFSVISIAYYNLINKKFTTQKFVAVTLVIVYFLGYLINLSSWTPWELGQLGGVFNSKKTFDDILEAKKEKKYVQNPNIDGKIEFKNLTHYYDKNDKPIFNNFSFTVNKGSKMAILGKSGTGKTTLVKLLLGFYQPKDGDILINNISISTINPEDLRSKINYINQKTSLLDGSIIDNIKYGNDISEKEIIDLLKKYGLLDSFSKFKNGIYSDVGFQGRSLSGGMQKIIMNVRGILKKGNIIIFDEPLTGLDAHTREKMITLIQEQTKGKTLIIITHDKEILKIVDKVINLNQLQ